MCRQGLCAGGLATGLIILGLLQGCGWENPSFWFFWLSKSLSFFLCTRFLFSHFHPFFAIPFPFLLLSPSACTHSAQKPLLLSFLAVHMYLTIYGRFCSIIESYWPPGNSFWFPVFLILYPTGLHYYVRAFYICWERWRYLPLFPPSWEYSASLGTCQNVYALKLLSCLWSWCGCIMQLSVK